MDQFNNLLQDGKFVICLNDLLSFKIFELKKFLFSYNEKVSGNKADLVLCTYAVFSMAKDSDSANLSTCRDSPIYSYGGMYS